MLRMPSSTEDFQQSVLPGELDSNAKIIKVWCSHIETNRCILERSLELEGDVGNWNGEKN